MTDATYYTCAACGGDLRESARSDCGNPWSHDIDVDVPRRHHLDECGRQDGLACTCGIVRPTAAGDNARHRPTTTAGASGLGDDYPQAHPRQGVGTITVSSQETIALIAAALLVNHTDDANQRLGHYTQHIHADDQCTLCRLLRRISL